MRHRAIENAKATQETLTSIIKLVDQIENMPVKDDVKVDVEGALDALEKVNITLFDTHSHV
jgi:phosphatidylinositol glycan class S